MRSFRPLILGAVVYGAAICIPGIDHALAQPPIASEAIAKLTDEGFVIKRVRRSFLGRIVITAEGNGDLREVVLNRVTGDILRDRTFEGRAEPTGDGRLLEPTAPNTRVSAPKPANSPATQQRRSNNNTSGEKGGGRRSDAGRSSSKTGSNGGNRGGGTGRGKSEGGRGGDRSR